MKVVTTGFLVVLAAVLGGCPEDRITWAPDGHQALIRASEGLYTTDAEGNLTLIVPEATGPVAWMGDSRRFLVQRRIAVKTWNEGAGLLNPAQTKQIIGWAEILLARALNWKGKLEEFGWRCEDAHMPDEALPLAVLYLRDHHEKVLGEKLGQHWGSLKEEDPFLFRFQLCQLREGKCETVRDLFVTLTEACAVRVSPKETAFAFTAPDSCFGEPRRTLFVAGLKEGDQPVRLMGCVSPGLAWSKDGQYLAFVEAETKELHGTEEYVLGSVEYLKVCDPQGAILSTDNWTSGIPVEDVATVFFDQKAGIDILPDGRIIFSAAEVHMPTSKWIRSSTSLFAVEPKGHGRIQRLLPPEGQQAGEEATLFQLSPDGQMVIIQSMRRHKESFGVFNLASGQRVFQSPTWDGSVFPVWRAKDSICFVGRSADQKPVVNLVDLRTKAIVPISAKWPKKVFEGLSGQN